MLKAEVIETLLLYGCVKWSPNRANFDRLQQVHHRILLRCLGWRRRKREDHTLCYADALVQADSESVEAAVRLDGGSCSRVSRHVREGSACRGG